MLDPLKSKLLRYFFEKKNSLQNFNKISQNFFYFIFIAKLFYNIKTTNSNLVRPFLY
jgi:hypothetical protein